MQNSDDFKIIRDKILLFLDKIVLDLTSCYYFN